MLGSALNFNIHLHMMVLDGVYTINESGAIEFHQVPAPHQHEMQTLLNRLIQRVIRRLERDGLLFADTAQPWLGLEFDEPMDLISAASVRYRIAIGPHSGSRTLTLHNSAVTTDKLTKPFTVARDGFSLNAAVACQLHPRDRLERLCR